jgi:septum formation protein
VSVAPQLILASGSPRRAALLRQGGYAFDVKPAAVDEDAYLQKFLPVPLAAFLAKAKADDVANRFGYEVTLAADTVVAFGDTPLGTPATQDDARAMIGLLSGTTHIVITGVAVRCPAREIDLHATVLSAVRMRSLSPREIGEYVASGLWKSKAGGYGIQDPEPLVTCVGGSISNVIGLPMEETRRLLEQAGIRPGVGA